MRAKPFKSLQRLLKNRKALLLLVLLGLGLVWFLGPRDYSKEAEKLDRLLTKKLLPKLQTYEVTDKKVEWEKEGKRKWKRFTLSLRFSSPVAFRDMEERLRKVLPPQYSILRERFYDNPIQQRKEFDIAFRRAVLYVLTEEWFKAKEVTPPKVVKPPVVLPRKEVKKPVAVRKGRGQIVFVLDDIGNTKQYVDMLFSISPPVTLSILPQLSYSNYFASEAHKRGFEAILHLPMEAEQHNGQLGPGAILTSMSDAEIRKTIQDDLESVPYRAGVSNHMGSRATADERVMHMVLNELAQKRLFFLDSKTSDHSVTGIVSREVGLPTLGRDIFLDNQDDPAYIRRQVDRVVAACDRDGAAIGIGHYRKNTIQILKEVVPELAKRGYQIVKLRDLL